MDEFIRWIYDPTVVLIGILIGVLQIVGVFAAGHAIMTNRTPQGTIGWVIFLLTFPTAAVPTYLVFGGHRFRGYIRARRTKDRTIRETINTYFKQVEACRVPISSNTSGVRVIEKLAHLPLTYGNHVELLIDGEAIFNSMLEGIDAAEDYIIIQFFIIRSDATGNRLRDHLLAKLAQGVRVYLLYDEIGCRKLSRQYCSDLKEAGAEVAGFNESQGWRHSLRLNFRNHRKIIIVDGKTAWVGGMNIGDEYLGLSKRFGHWRDTQVKITGPAVQCTQFTFLDDWYWANRKVPEFNWTPEPRTEEEHPHEVVVLSGGPADDVETITLAFLHAINQAQRRVWIQSPYFVPDDQIVSALQLAAMRGVDVRILLPEKPDHLLVWLSSFYYTGQEKLQHVRIFRYHPGFLHSKMLLVDNTFAAIGTANLDNRSFRINFEIMIGVIDSDFTNEVETVMKRDFTNAHEVGPEEYASRPAWFRIAARTARLLSPIQ